MFLGIFCWCKSRHFLCQLSLFILFPFQRALHASGTGFVKLHRPVRRELQTQVQEERFDRFLNREALAERLDESAADNRSCGMSLCSP